MWPRSITPGLRLSLRLGHAISAAAAAEPAAATAAVRSSSGTDAEASVSAARSAAAAVSVAAIAASLISQHFAMSCTPTVSAPPGVRCGSEVTVVVKDFSRSRSSSSSSPLSSSPARICARRSGRERRWVVATPHSPLRAEGRQQEKGSDEQPSAAAGSTQQKQHSSTQGRQIAGGTVQAGSRQHRQHMWRGGCHAFFARFEDLDDIATSCLFSGSPL